MVGQAGIHDSAEERARWEGFAWTDDNARRAAEIITEIAHGPDAIGLDPAADRPA